MAGTSKAHKVDLHVHSSHSDRPYSWFLRSTGAAECYTAVDQAYAIARRRGMDLVTLADHDVIDGALALCERHPGDTFVSVEVSARFPEDGCIVHVICVDVTEAQHRELQRLRYNVYELVDYIRAQDILHAQARRYPSLEIARYGLDVLGLRVNAERVNETPGM